MKEYWKELIPSLITGAMDLIVAFFMLWIGAILIRFIMKGIRKLFDRKKIDPTVRSFLLPVLRYTLYAILAYGIFEKLGLFKSSLLAIMGSLGIAIGLALQGSLQHLAGGVLILVLRPFRVGDYIIEHNTNREGTVESIGIFYTTILTTDTKKVVIPNGTLANHTITNVTERTERMLQIDIGITYEADLKKGKEVLRKLLSAVPERNKEKGDPKVVVAALQDSSVLLRGRIYVPKEVYWERYWELLENAKLALDEAGVGIAYPNLSVHIESVPENDAEEKKGVQS